jgi:hypothetical protein
MRFINSYFYKYKKTDSPEMKKSFLFILLLLFILFSCKQDPLDVDISSIKTEPLQILRLDEDLFTLTPADFEEKSRQIRNKYGTFYEHYLMNPLGINGTRDSAYKAAVLNFVMNRDIKEAKAYTQKLYPQAKVEEMGHSLDACVKRFKYHFPKKKQPTKFVICITGWNFRVAYIDSALVAGLDMYLGDTAKFYKMLAYPQYQTRKLDQDHLIPDLVRGWLLTEFDNATPENTLLGHTIFYGKLFYAIEALLPNTEDSLLIGYTAKQMETCKRYEKNYWSYFAEKNRLYDNNMNTVRELTSDGPFTAAISKECPPYIAMWIGWQIVRSYMKNNESVTLEKLMMDNNAQGILSKSKYRP